MILRLFIEKKKEYDTAARRLLYLLSGDVKLERGTDIRVFYRYDISGVSADFFERVKYDILADDECDNVFNDYLPLTGEWKTVALTHQPGQHAENERLIHRAFRLCGISGGFKIATATVYAFGEDIKPETVEQLRALLVAPDSEVAVAADRSLAAKKPKAANDRPNSGIEDFIKMNDIEVYQFRRTAGFKMSSADLCALRDYYKERERSPQLLELMALDSCRAVRPEWQQTVFGNIQINESPLNLPIKITLEEYQIAKRALFGERNIAPSLDDIAGLGLLTLKQRGLAGDIERDENGRLRINLPADINGVYDQWLLGFRCVRDRQHREYDCDGTVVGELMSDKLCCYHALHIDCDSRGGARRVIDNVKTAAARSSYLSQNGIATQSANVLLPDYDKTHLEFSAVAAAAPRTNMLRCTVSQGDCIFMLGGRLGGEDHAATGAAHFVQHAQPEVRRRISRLLAQPAAALMAKRVCSADDGLFNAVCTLCGDGMGAVIDFDRVLKPGSTDIASVINSSNERMLVLCDKDNRDGFTQLCQAQGLAAEVIAMVAPESIYRIYSKGQELAKIDESMLKIKRRPAITDVIIDEPSENRINDGIVEELVNLPLTEAFLRNLALNCTGEYQLSDLQYDWSVGAATVLAPFGGKMQSSPEEAMICKIPADGKLTNTVTALSYGCTQNITAISPFHGAAFSIMQSISKIVASGANSLTIKLGVSQNTRPAGELPSRWGKPVGAMLGAYAACTGMGLPIIDSAVSVQPEDAPPTPFAFCSFALATAKTNEIITCSFKKVGSSVLLVPMPTVNKTGMPDFDRARVIYRQLHYLSQSGKVLAAAVVKGGGVAAAVAKMSFGSNLGVRFTLSDRKLLFSNMTASIVVETNSPGAFSGMDTINIGVTTVEECFDFSGAVVSIKNAFSVVRGDTERSYARFSSLKVPMTNITLNKSRQIKRSTPAIAAPTVLVPCFGGESGDRELCNAFEAAGGNVKQLFFDYEHIDNSAAELVKALNSAQILALPDGVQQRLSVNLAVYALSNEKVAESLQQLILRDGLVLGIGRGFDALLRLRLFDLNETYPRLSPNILGKTVCQLASVRITSAKSPWLSGVNAGDCFTTALHCQYGRLVATEQAIYRLSKAGQIATQYVDYKRQPSGKQQFNPTGSTCAIEGLTNATGRIFGRVGHDERYSSGCYTNVSGRKNQSIFESGIDYFK